MCVRMDLAAVCVVMCTNLALVASCPCKHLNMDVCRYRLGKWVWALVHVCAHLGWKTVDTKECLALYGFKGGLLLGRCLIWGDVF